MARSKRCHDLKRKGGQDTPMLARPSDKATRKEGLSHNGETEEDEDRRVAGRRKDVSLNVVVEDEQMEPMPTATGIERDDIPVVVQAEEGPEEEKSEDERERRGVSQ